MAEENLFGSELGFGEDNLLDLIDATPEVTATEEQGKDIKPVEETPTDKVKEEKEPETVEDPLSLFEEEEEDTKEDKKETETPTEEPEDEEDEVNNFEEISKGLVNLGVFSFEDGEEIPKDGNAFADKFKQAARKQAEFELSDFLTKNHPENIDLFNAIFINGVKPSDYLPKYNESKSLESIDLENEASQKYLVTESLKAKGLPADKIQARIDKYIERDELKEEAEIAYDKLSKEIESNLRNQEIEAQQAQQRKVQQHNDYVNAIVNVYTEKTKTKTFDGIPLNDKQRDEVIDFTTTQKWRLQDGSLATDFDKFLIDLKHPQNIELRAKVALLAKNNFDLTKIKSTAISEESDKIFNTLATKKVKKQVKDTKKETATNSWFNI